MIIAAIENLDGSHDYCHVDLESKSVAQLKDRAKVRKLLRSYRTFKVGNLSELLAKARELNVTNTCILDTDSFWWKY